MGKSLGGTSFLAIFFGLSAPAGERPASTLSQDLALKGEIWFFSK